MKKLLIKIVLFLLIVQNSFGQFHKFAKAQGFIVSQGASITSAADAGGGVVLKGVAKPKYPDSLSVFTNVTFDEVKGVSTMYFQTQKSIISFSDSSWLMRDAVMLVKSESADTMYRDVNLLGRFTQDDYANGYDTLYPLYEFFNVEMVDSLRNTKSGQTLLYLDIILAGNANTEYYSNNKEAFLKYIASKDSLREAVQEYNNSVKNLRNKSINNMYLKLKNFDSQRQSGEFNSSEITFFNKIKHYSVYYLFKNELGYKFSYYDDTVRNYSTEIDSLFNPNYYKHEVLKHAWTDYTYNDEKTNYAFYITKKDKHINIEGKPNYTFLYHNFEDETEIDSLFTNYYIQHHDLIKNLNYVVVTNAEHFGKIAAFYRYLKSEYPNLWNQVYKHYSQIRKTKGETPRFIGRYPSDEY